jgi:DNA modification methylase
VDQIAASIKEWGWTVPVLVDEEGGLIAGHGRVLAAKKLGLKEIPVMTAAGWSEGQKRAYVLADNKLALNAGWDNDLLKVELEELKELNFDIDLTGFGIDELADLLSDKTEGLTDPDEVPEPPAEPITVLGDVWLLGNHRIICGDSTDINIVEKLLNGAIPDMVYTDPPYGISIVQGASVGGSKPFGSKDKQGTVGGGKLAKVNSYSPVIGDETIDTAINAINLITYYNPKVQIIWGGNYYASYLPNSPCWIVWDKQNTGNFADCELAWTNQKTAVRQFTHMWNGMLRASEKGSKRVHPTQKPVALADWCIDNYGQECSSVLDLFSGSGSTLISCCNKFKTAFLAELSPVYVDVAITRWQDFTGNKATHAETGKTFDEMKAERANVGK